MRYPTPNEVGTYHQAQDNGTQRPIRRGRRPTKVIWCRLRVLPTFGALVILAPSGVPLSAQSIVVRGTVIDTTDRRIAGALVRATCPDGTTAVTTGPDGNFHFPASAT